MEEKLQKDIEAMVTEIFSKKEEAEMREMTELELQKAANTIEDLTSVLETKKDEFVVSEEKLVEANEKIESLESELEAARQEIETSNDKLSETEKALEEIKKDQITNVRMSELEEAKVTRSDKEAQSVKVRDMSDDEFAAYKEELVAIRQSVVAELEANIADPSATAEEEEEVPSAVNPETEEGEASEEEANEAEEAEEAEEEDTPPANVDPGEAMAAALNMETAAIDEDILSKYTNLGVAMADNMKKQTEL